MKDVTPDPPQLSFPFDAPEPERDLAAERRAKRAAYMREWTAKNAERVNEQRRAHRVENPETLERERSWRNKNSDKVREYKRGYYWRDPETQRERSRQYAKENRDACNANHRKQYWKDVEKTRAKDREDRKKRHEEALAREAAYREQRRETFREYAREYYHRTKDERHELLLRASQKRRALVKGAEITDVEFEAVLIRDAGHCGLCGKPVRPEDLSFDHIVPLARGGPHCAENLQVAHIRCNKSKGAKLPADLKPPHLPES